MEKTKKSVEIPEPPVEIVVESKQVKYDVLQIRDGVFEIKGKAIEKQAKLLDPDNREAMAHLHRRLGRMGVLRRVARLGARPGDKIIIADREVEYRG